MADNILDIGSTVVWRPSVNWVATPSYDYNLGRKIKSFTGTTTLFEIQTQEKPQILEFLLTALNKQGEFDFLSFWHQQKGMLKRFWFPVPINFFTLKFTHSSGVSQLTFDENAFDFRTFERFYILMKNGDLITRAMTDFSTDTVAHTSTVTFATVTDRPLDPLDIDKIGFLLLCRFDIDEADISVKTDSVCEVTIRILELVQEYSLA